MKKINLKLLWEVVKFGFSKVSIYPFEVFAYIGSRFVNLIMISLFWYALSLSTPGVFNFRSIIAYFLVMDGLKTLTYGYELKLSKTMADIIKQGEISNYLIKPINAIPYLTAEFTGDSWLQYVFSFFTLTAGLIILPPTHFINIILCLVFCFLGAIISIALNVLIATLNFYSPEAGGMRNAINHIIKVLSGTFVPLTFFPLILKQVILLSPFPSTAFMPVYILQNTLPTIVIVEYLIIAIFWAIILTIISNKWWKYSLKHYESIGR